MSEKQPWFKPTLSFDGVAAIALFAGAAYFSGTINAKVDAHTETLKEHAAVMQMHTDKLDALVPEVAVHDEILKHRPPPMIGPRQ